MNLFANPAHGLITPHMLLTNWRAWLVLALVALWLAARAAWFAFRVAVTLYAWPLLFVVFEGRTLLLLPELDTRKAPARFTLTGNRVEQHGGRA